MGGSGSAAARVASKYKRMILMGKVRLPLEVARTLVGPDCAYHLYFTEHDQPKQASGSKRRRKGQER